MRLLDKNLKNVYCFQKTSVDSEYVGTKEKFVYKRRIKCNVQPAESKITSEIYGERVHGMLKLIFVKGYNVYDAVSFRNEYSEPSHKIIAVDEYSDYSVALAEVII